jgi:hypothetical protein
MVNLWYCFNNIKKKIYKINKNGNLDGLGRIYLDSGDIYDGFFYKG